MHPVGLILSQMKTVSSPFTSYLLNYRYACNASKSLLSPILPIAIMPPFNKAVFLVAKEVLRFNLGNFLSLILDVFSSFKWALPKKEARCP
jgi:hypothetical protein